MRTNNEIPTIALDETMSQFDDAMGKVGELCERNPVVDNLVTTGSKMTGMRKEYIALAGAALPFLFLLLMFCVVVFLLCGCVLLEFVLSCVCDVCVVRLLGWVLLLRA